MEPPKKTILQLLTHLSLCSPTVHRASIKICAKYTNHREG
jgi:hypothetical protein